MNRVVALDKTIAIQLNVPFDNFECFHSSSLQQRWI